MGSVGIRVQVEPCGDPAFAQMTYQFGGTSWESAGRIEAGGSPFLFSIPGASLYGSGLYISVSVMGDAADLSVHARLSACLGDECDGAVMLVGSLLAGLGFPLPLLEFDDLAFVDSCPAQSFFDKIITFASDNVVVTVAAGSAVLVCAIAAVYFCKRKKANLKANLNVPERATV